MKLIYIEPGIPNWAQLEKKNFFWNNLDDVTVLQKLYVTWAQRSLVDNMIVRMGGWEQQDYINVICSFQCYMIVTCHKCYKCHKCYMWHDSEDSGREAVTGLELNVICSFRLLHFMPSRPNRPSQPYALNTDAPTIWRRKILIEWASLIFNVLWHFF